MGFNSKSKWIFFSIGAALCSLVQGGDQTNSQVTLSLDEFQELFSSARLEEAERRLMDQRKIQEAEHKQRLKELSDCSKLSDAEAKQQRGVIFPDNFQVLHHTVSGLFNSSAPSSGVEGDGASFDQELTLRVMESKWTTVPIVNTTSIVASNWEVAWRGDGNSEFEPVDPVTDSEVILVLREGQQVLATNQSGLFKINFNAYTRVSKTRNLNTMGLSSLLYPISEFSFRIATDDSYSARDFSVQPPSAVLQVHSEDTYMDIQTTLPLTTDQIQIRWLDAAEIEEGSSVLSAEEASAGPDHKQKGENTQIIATHEVLHTVGEGIIQSLHTLEFETTNEMSSPLNSVTFIVHGDGIRVASVTGHALQSWSVDDGNETLTSKVVRASFKSSQIESSVVLHVNTEMDRRGSSVDQVELPRIESRNVLRQTGHIAIIKDANVEVHEHMKSGLSRCEPSDVPSRLRLNVDRPIVISYKYLSPQHSVVLNVKDHVAMDTLEATVDRLHYKAIVTDTHIVHSLILILQSTKLQYLELHGLPSTASLFTVVVNSVPTKPVQGIHGDNSVLIPLLIGLNADTANEGGSCQTSVELNYISSHEPLGQNGTLQLAPPHLSLPISVLTTHLRLPNIYEYEFSGAMKRSTTNKLEYPIPSAFSYTTAKRVVREDYEFSAIDDVWPEDEEFRNKVGAVKMVAPSTGRSFYFHRLLVVDSAPSLNVTYAEHPKERMPWWLPRFLTS